MNLERYNVSIIIFLTFFISALFQPIIQVIAIYLSWTPIELAKQVINIPSNKSYLSVNILLALASLYLYIKVKSNLDKTMGGILFSISVSGLSIFFFEEVNISITLQNCQFIITSFFIGGILISIDNLRNI